ncbi:MAG: flagellar protein FlaG [Pseudomonadota bacterium]|nr:flagellar protein FlaG [Pseudomonadota bacterium]
MELPSNKPVPGVSTLTSATGRYPSIAVAVQEVVQPVQPVSEVKPPVQKIEQTQAAIAEQVSRYLSTSTRNLEFQVDGESGSPVIVVRDVAGNVIRRIPGEEALQRMLRASAESGTLIDSIA